MKNHQHHQERNPNPLFPLLTRQKRGLIQLCAMHSLSHLLPPPSMSVYPPPQLLLHPVW